MSLPLEIEREFSELRNGSRFLRAAPGASKDKALLEIASRLLSAEAELLRANAEDLARLPSDALPSFRDRLTITSERLGGMLESLRQVAALPDPVGEVVEQRVLANGLKIRRVRSPLGVIFMVFESRPNVALEAFSLAFKAGNTIGLRGGRDSASTVAVLYRVMREALVASGFPASSFYGMTDYDRAHVTSVLQRKDLVDIAVPRGSEKLIQFFEETAAMPIIKNDRGLCHAYVDDEADLDMAVDIVDNAKTQRPGVCNSLETVLVNSKVADEFLRKLVAKTASKNLHYRADQRSLEKLQSALSAPSSNASSAAASSLGSSASSSSQSTPVATLATSIDFDTEYLDLILNVKIVADLSEAIAHIEKHGSRHSETIITRNESKARRFQSDIDAAAVYWNASTRFTDGFALGLGGELGISTQKLHVRGPVGLRELTTPRWIIDGTGQIRS
jgi:glutamate-5-semialdehyde dehydrogenase